MQQIRPEEIWDRYEKCPVCNIGPRLCQGYICDYCGWASDFVQEDEKDWEECGNKLSFNQFKAEYERRLKINPKYIWLKYRYTKRGY